MVGTFYRASAPGAKSFVEVGSQVKEGETICIIEAMKILNEIEADKAGTVSPDPVRERPGGRIRPAAVRDRVSMFKKILVANRGEIACGISGPASELGVKAVMVYSEPTARPSTSSWRRRRLHRPGAVAQSYLNMPAIISAAEVTDAEAIHPGYGFLSENADFAERVEKSGFPVHRPDAETSGSWATRSRPSRP
jgi:acetyl/propionyl-CoA carboxylase alpha subunit